MDTLPPHVQIGDSHYIIIPLTQGKFAMVDIEDAAKAYDRTIIRLKGNRAITNFPLEDYDIG